MKKIQIDVKKDGTIDIEAFGYNGVGCVEATKVFEEALGTVTDREKKSDYYQSQTQGQSLHNRNKN